MSKVRQRRLVVKKLMKIIIFNLVKKRRCQSDRIRSPVRSGIRSDFVNSPLHVIFGKLPIGTLEDNLEEMIKLMQFSARAKAKRFHRKSLVEFEILLLISDRHIGACPSEEHQHGVSIQSSVKSCAVFG